MASDPDRLQGLENKRRELETIRLDYTRARESLHLEDLLSFINRSYEADMARAKGEMENPNKAQAYLQKANAYGIVRTYITDKFD